MLILGATLTERTTRVGLARKLLRSSELLNAGTNIIAFEMELASRQTVDMMTVERHHAREKNSQSQGKEDSQVECGLFFSKRRKGGRK